MPPTPDAKHEPGKRATAASPGRTAPDPSTTPTDILPGPGLAPLTERYEILEELGSGGMGIVYRARDRETGDQVALKILKPEIASDPELLERFKGELRMARRITHRNVCRAHEMLRFGDSVVIAMEFVDGESLRRVLRRYSGLPLRKVIQLARELCGGLREAHAQGIVHRDLKPENIMLDGTGAAKILDFGIALSHDSATMHGFAGTPQYMAPEQAEGRTVDARTDIYALGLVLYEVLCGTPAVEAATPSAAVLKQVNEDPPPPRAIDPTIPRHIEKAVMKCLEKYPGKRFQSVDELEAALTRGVEVEERADVTAALPQDIVLPARLQRWGRSDWGLLGAGVAGLAVFLALFSQCWSYAASAITVDSGAAIGKAKAIIEKYAPETRGDYLAFYITNSSVPQQAVKGPGAISHSGSWRIIGPTTRSAPGMTDGRSRVVMSATGDVSNVALTVPAELIPSNAASVAEATEAAAAAAEDLFHADVRNVAPASVVWNDSQKRWQASTSTYRGPALVGIPHGITPVTWTIGAGESARTISMKMAGARVIAADSYPTNQLTAADSDRAYRLYLIDRQWNSLPGVWMACVLLYAAFLMGLLLVRRLYQKTPMPILWPVLAVTIGLVLIAAAVGWPESRQGPAANVTFMFALVCTLVFGLLLTYGLMAVGYHYLFRRMPERLKSVLAMREPAAGLAMLRGFLIGAAYAGLHAALLWMLERLHLAGPSGFWWDLSSGASEQTAFLFGIATPLLAAALGGWLLLGVPAALASRGWRAPLLVTTMLWMLVGATLVGGSTFPLPYMYLFVAVEAPLFAAILLRYDLLTTMAAIFAAEIALISYPIFVMVRGFQPWAAALLVAYWASVVGWAVFFAFRGQLHSGWKRIAAVFE